MDFTITFYFILINLGGAAFAAALAGRNAIIFCDREEKEQMRTEIVAWIDREKEQLLHEECEEQETQKD